jgi:hypothetical protein
LAFGPIDGSVTAAPAPSGNSTAVAAYLTTISNTPAMRQARVWKRFVRVRTDDLESVRVERAIKRVRSDLASHTGGGGLRGKENIAVEEPVSSAEPTPAPVIPAVEPAPAPIETTTDTLSVPESTATRIPRSHSADPDKRISRAFSHTPDEQTDVEDQTGTSSQAGETDDSSLSTTGHRDTARASASASASTSSSAPKKRASKKKLRALSVGVVPRKSTRKVVIDDFEMMRVLGKGCAGKVLLVKHKTTADLYALKAITKRHVLAHQELQHTLTEQAVLKRMAAESKDPFVVKLWWSFHDKENLFLVMDFHPGGDLATQLARWGRLGRDRARFYAAEIVEGVEGLHAADLPRPQAGEHPHRRGRAYRAHGLWALEGVPAAHQPDHRALYALGLPQLRVVLLRRERHHQRGRGGDGREWEHGARDAAVDEGGEGRGARCGVAGPAGRWDRGHDDDVLRDGGVFGAGGDPGPSV